MTTEQALVVGTVVAAFGFAISVTAAIAVWRMARLGELVPYEPGPRAKTGLLEFALVFSAFIAGQALGVLAARPFASASEMSPPPARVDLPGELPAEDLLAPPEAARKSLSPGTLFGAGLGALATVLAVYLAWRLVADRGPRTLATRDRLATVGSDVGLGFRAFLMTAAPVYGLQALLSPLFPERHEILERLDAAPDLSFLLAAGFAAAIAAPVVEEIVFRGFLQSAFSGMRYGRGSPIARLFLGAPIEAGERAGSELEPAYETPDEFRRRGGTFGEGLRRTLAGIGSPPVVASSLFFSLMHLGHGSAPIPLFFFALTLGYLYRQTGRLAAPIAAHFALNAATLLLAVGSLLTDAPSPERPPPESPSSGFANGSATQDTRGRGTLDPFVASQFFVPRDGKTDSRRGLSGAGGSGLSTSHRTL